MGDKAILAMDWDAQGMHLWLMGIAWQSTPICCIPNEEILIRMWLKNPTDDTWKRVWPQIRRAWKNKGSFLQQNGLVREFKKQQQFSKKQTKNANRRWHNERRNQPNKHDATAYANAYAKPMPKHARAGNALQSSSAEAEEERKKKEEERGARPLGGAAPLPAQADKRQHPENGNGAFRGGQIAPPAHPKACVVEAGDEQRSFGHEDFLAIGERNPKMPTNISGWEQLERSLDKIERMQSKMREKFHLERWGPKPAESATEGESDDVF